MTQSDVPSTESATPAAHGDQADATPGTPAPSPKAKRRKAATPAAETAEAALAEAPAPRARRKQAAPPADTAPAPIQPRRRARPASAEALPAEVLPVEAAAPAARTRRKAGAKASATPTEVLPVEAAAPAARTRRKAGAKAGATPTEGDRPRARRPPPAAPLAPDAVAASAEIAPPAPQARRRFTRRRAISLIAGLCLCAALLGGGALLFRKLNAPAPAQPLAAISGALLIDAAKSAKVGDAVTVTVGAAAATDGQPATLTMITSYGPHVYRSAFAGGTARFLIPGDDTHQSGEDTLIAMAGAARGEAALTIEPGTPIDPVTPLVGPRSITADTKHWSMSVIVPFDRFGNPVADGTPVEIRALHPGEQLELQRTEIHNMVGWARIFSRTHAGRTTVSAAAAGQHGPDATFMEVPSWPAQFALSASPTNVPADGRQFVTLRTEVIRDEYGNPMLDGTLVTFIADTPNGEPRLIPAYTIDGVAKALLQAPNQPAQLTVRAEIYDAESDPLQVTFGDGPAIGTFPVEARIDAAGQAIDLKAGPMLGALQQFIPDGTLVEFWLTDATGQRMRIEAVAKNGYAQAVARLASLPLGTYVAEADVGAGHGRVAFQVPYETSDKQP